MEAMRVLVCEHRKSDSEMKTSFLVHCTERCQRTSITKIPLFVNKNAEPYPMCARV